MISSAKEEVASDLKKDSSLDTGDTAVAEGDESAEKYDPKNKHRKSSFGDKRPSRIVESGWDLLDNNDVNFLMAVIMSTGAMWIAAWSWGIPPKTILNP